MIPQKGLLNEFLQTASSSNPSEQHYIYRKDPLQKVNDYTKNISQSIFSPGLLPTKATVSRTIHSRAKPEPKTSSKLKKLNTIERMLSEETSSKERLRRDIDEVKSNLTRFKQLVK